MAYGLVLFGVLFSALSSLPPARNRGIQAQEARVWQGPASVSVLIGEDLRLECQVSDGQQAGPVKWFLGEGRQEKLIYRQTHGNEERIKRNSPGSNTDFTIFIQNVTLEDAGTYYCVKEKRKSDDRLKGRGTLVVVKDSRDSPVNPVAAGQSGLILVAAGVSGLILVALFCAALVFYRHKRRGLRSRKPRSDPSVPQKQPSSKQASQDQEMVYADLKDPVGLQIPRKINLEERSEYATIKGAVTGTAEKGPSSV